MNFLVQLLNGRMATDGNDANRFMTFTVQLKDQYWTVKNCSAGWYYHTGPKTMEGYFSSEAQAQDSANEDRAWAQKASKAHRYVVNAAGKQIGFIVE